MSTGSVLLNATAWALACILFAAGAAKLTSPRVTAARIDAYALLGKGAGRMLALPLGGVEIAAGAALALPSSRVPGAVLAAALLAIYSAAIAINLRRGNRDIDCGCGPGTRELPLSGALFARNAVLIGVALVNAGAEPAIPGTAGEWLRVGLVGAAALLTYAVVNGLLASARWPADD